MEKERIIPTINNMVTMLESEAMTILKRKSPWTFAMKVEDLVKPITEDDYAQAINTALFALDKQIPIKPILKNGKGVIFKDYADGHGETEITQWQDWVCPKCGWFVGQRYNLMQDKSIKHSHDQRKSNYCNECGQRIDWTKED